MSVAALETALARHGLTGLGAFHTRADDDLPGIGTLVLVGPAEPGFWGHFTASPEYRDAQPQPMDRWSTRVLTALGDQMGARPLFPFGGPPWHPFHRWALRSGWAFDSPVALLVHARAGLWVSYRGALGFAARLDLPPPPASPCEACAGRPCLSACPVGALTGSGYDLPACHAHLATPAGAPCMTGGCRVRAACPVAQKWGREAGQSAFHMAAFHK